MDSEQPLSPVRITSGNIFSRARQAYRRNGLYFLIRLTFKYLIESCYKALPNFFCLRYYKLFNSNETFEFQGNKFRYFFHSYCPTWKNERAAVVPIAWDIVKKYQQQHKRILEVGNMLSYLFDTNHDIIDKYEVADGVINEDVATFRSSKKYDLIISIMTLQWVGLKESPPEPLKFLNAIDNLKKNLAPGGQFIVIHGIGENEEMDKLLANGRLRFNHQYYLKRIKRYKFTEVNWEDIKDLKYDHKVPTANGVVIGIIES